MPGSYRIIPIAALAILLIAVQVLLEVEMDGRSLTAQISLRSSTGGILRGGTPTRADICFITFEFGPPGHPLEPLANLSRLGLRLPEAGESFQSNYTAPPRQSYPPPRNYRYVAFVNDPETDTGDWEKVIVEPDPRFIRPKTMASQFKFVAWQHPAMDSCRTIFPMDGTKFPVPEPAVWADLEARIHSTPGGVLLQKKVYKRKVTALLDGLVSWQKDSPEFVNATKTWLLSRHDFDPGTVCLFTNFFGYDPANQYYQEMSSEFWHYYSTEMLTARDQPLFSYFVDRHKEDLQPIYLKHFGYESHKKDPDYELLPYIDFCSEAKLNKKRKSGEEIDKTIIQIPTYFDPDLATEICEKSQKHDFTGLQTFD